MRKIKKKRGFKRKDEVEKEKALK
jgi:hypothetical protein